MLMIALNAKEYHMAVVIDLQNRYTIDLLDERKAESFRIWIENHDKVCLVSRERSTDYSAAISATGRPIVKVADYFLYLFAWCKDKYSFE